MSRKVEWMRCFKCPKPKLDLFLVKLNFLQTDLSYFEAAYIFDAGPVYDVVVYEYKGRYPFQEHELEDFVKKLMNDGRPPALPLSGPGEDKRWP